MGLLDKLFGKQASKIVRQAGEILESVVEEKLNDASDNREAGSAGTAAAAYAAPETSAESELSRIERWSDTDTRSDAQLKADVERILRNDPALSGYTIEAEVSPAAFDADAFMADYVPEGYSVERYGRPVSFVLRNAAGDMALCIMIAKQSAHSHTLVCWYEMWCRAHRVPYLNLYLGLANTDHYVLRKTHEKLGIID